MKKDNEMTKEKNKQKPTFKNLSSQGPQKLNKAVIPTNSTQGLSFKL